MKRVSRVSPTNDDQDDEETGRGRAPRDHVARLLQRQFRRSRLIRRGFAALTKQRCRPRGSSRSPGRERERVHRVGFPVSIITSTLAIALAPARALWLACKWAICIRYRCNGGGGGGGERRTRMIVQFTGNEKKSGIDSAPW